MIVAAHALDRGAETAVARSGLPITMAARRPLEGRHDSLSHSVRL